MAELQWKQCTTVSVSDLSYIKALKIRCDCIMQFMIISYGQQMDNDIMIDDLILTYYKYSPVHTTVHPKTMTSLTLA